VPELDPAYLIHGDDHGRVSERRSGLRALAERQDGGGNVESFEGEAATPEQVAAALDAMTFAIGRRVLIVDGVERWKEAELAPLLAALAALPPDTTVAFFGREEGRSKVPAKLAKAVEKAGGRVAREEVKKGRELQGWVVEQARGMGLQMDTAAARLLVARVGDRQQRLRRELEKLALEHGAGARISEDEVEAAAASAERQIWVLADALVARNAPAALQAYLDLRGQGERLTGLLFSMTRRVRDAAEVAERLAAGESAGQVTGSLRMPRWAAQQFVKDVQRSDVRHLRAALDRLAELELASRGGEELDEDTAATRAILAIAA
jgi:DNA polymerase III subunit delta